MTLLVLVDEAYHEFVQDDRYRTAIPLALSRENVIVLRTFSKVHSLAAFRVGYAVGHRDTLYHIRKAQQPLAVTTASQAAALASLGQPGRSTPQGRGQRRGTPSSLRRHSRTRALSGRESHQLHPLQDAWRGQCGSDRRIHLSGGDPAANQRRVAPSDDWLTSKRTRDLSRSSTMCSPSWGERFRIYPMTDFHLHPQP